MVNAELDGVQAAKKIDIDRLEVWRKQVAVGIYVFLEQRDCWCNSSVGEHVVNLAVLLLCRFEPAQGKSGGLAFNTAMLTVRVVASSLSHPPSRRGPKLPPARGVG